MGRRNSGLIVNNTTATRISRHQYLLHSQVKGNLIDERKTRLRKESRKELREEGKDYIQSEHGYELVIGKTGTGIQRTMLGREAKLLNDKSKIKWMASVGTDKQKPLSRWVWQRRDDELSKG